MRHPRIETALLSSLKVILNFNQKVFNFHNIVFTIQIKKLSPGKKIVTFKTTYLASLTSPKAPCQKLLLYDEESQQKMLKNFELPAESFFELKKQWEEAGIEFLTTAFDLDSLFLINKVVLI